MPNYVKHKVSFSGSSESIDDILKYIKTDDNGYINHIDFNKIIPMPESLNITSGSQTDIGVAILKYIENKDDTLLKERLAYSAFSNKGYKNVDDILKDYQSREDYQLMIDNGRIAIDNFKNYGHQDWYTWACENWGTKWNAGSTSYNGEVLEFETAWSTPLPIMIKLSEIFPSITFTVQYADEDIGSNCGQYTLLNGKELYYESFDGIKACEVWGYDPAEYYPDIMRDRQIDKILDENNK